MTGHRSMAAWIGVVWALVALGLAPAQQWAAAAPKAAVAPPSPPAAAKQKLSRLVEAEVDLTIEQLDLIFARVDPSIEGNRKAMQRVFEQLAFERLNLPAWRTGLIRSLDAEILTARQTLSLTPADERKLRLAAEGDMKRYFDEVERIRAEVPHALGNPARQRDLLAGIRRLKRASVFGLFGEGSIYSKVLEKIRRDRQSAEGDSC